MSSVSTAARATAEAMPLLLGRFHRIGGGTQQDRQVDDLGNRDDAAKPLDLFAQFVAEGGDQRVFAPAIAIRR